MKRAFLGAAVLAWTGAVAARAESVPARPTFGADGVVRVPAFDLPPSEFSTPEARELMKLRAKNIGGMPKMEPDIEKSRQSLTAMLAPQVAQMLAAYPVDVAEKNIAGVPVRVVTPKTGKAAKGRVLINLHGGAFQTCWESCSLLESAPIAAAGYKVVSVNYRMAPEAKHPAGVEDVEKVYRELLKDYDARRIGIYGCSAGGVLTAQAAAWLPARDLPQAGAIGIFGAGGARFSAGDSAYIAAYIDGSFPAPARPGEPEIDLTRGYFDGADIADPVISPALHQDVLKTFPPTLIVTGTRAIDMSPAIYTNSQLLKAGVRSTLIVGEAMGHCYIYLPNLPEARDARDAIVAFFRENLQ